MTVDSINADASSVMVGSQFCTAESINSLHADPSTEQPDVSSINYDVEWVEKIDNAFWEKLLSEGKEYGDNSPVSAWKDELSNLLIFVSHFSNDSLIFIFMFYPQIGIFSAVVTGFLVISVPLLQENPVTSPTQLLVNIPSPPTTAASNLSISVQSNSTSQFATSKQVVQVNILWTCSLSLCFTTAFYTISAQQWLRHLTVPLNLVPRETVLLKELYTIGVSSWRVEDLINMLPTLIQVAVVLFLSGMAVFLKEFDTTVFTIFFAVSFGPLALWLVVSIIPFIDLHCPYKSPAVLAALLLFRIITLPMLFALSIIAILIAEMICGVSVHILWLLGVSEERTKIVQAAFHTIGRGHVDRFISTQFGEVLLQWTHFRHWTSCELSFINDKESSEGLAFNAIRSTLQKLSPDRSKKLFKECLIHIPTALYLKFTLKHYLLTHFERHNRKTFATLLRKDSVVFVGDYSTDHDILFQILEEMQLCLTGLFAENTPSGAVSHQSIRRNVKDIVELICLIHRATLSSRFQSHCSIAERIPNFVHEFVDHLVQLQNALLRDTIQDPCTRIPVSLIFFYCTKYSYHASLSLQGMLYTPC